MYKRLNQNDLRKEAMNGAQWPVKRKEKKCCHLIERAYYEIIVNLCGLEMTSFFI